MGYDISKWNILHPDIFSIFKNKNFPGGDNFFTRYITQRVYKVCIGINYKIVPVIDFEYIFTPWFKCKWIILTYLLHGAESFLRS